MSRSARLVVLCGALIVALSMGIRQAFGLFLPPLTEALALGRETFSLAIAWQNLLLAFPLIGIAADRFGYRRVAILGAIAYAAGLLAMTRADSAWALHANLGALVGLAQGATGYVVVLGAIGQVVPAERRGAAFGLTTAVGSFGMFAMVGVTQVLLAAVGWAGAFAWLAAMATSMALLALGLPGRRPAPAPGAAAAPELSLAETFRGAARHAGYWLLIAGFFVCGFHVAFIATHLPAYLRDQGVSAGAAAIALALIGLFNMAGSYLFGRLGDVVSKRYLLSLLYFLRAIVIGLLLLLPTGDLTAIGFGAAIGFLWLATVPLTSGLVAQIFGARYMATLYGLVFLSHQVGAFLGVWLGGRVYDLTGDYQPVWLGAVALALFAALVHLPIREEPWTPAARPARSSTGPPPTSGKTRTPRSSTSASDP
jgi:MFS family permease